MAATRSALGGPARVLLVGEEPMARLMSLALDHGAYVSRIATNLADAERDLQDWKPHLAVVDIDLERRAIDLLAARGTGGAPLPTIAITKRAGIRTKLAAFDRGADDFVTARSHEVCS